MYMSNKTVAIVFGAMLALFATVATAQNIVTTLRQFIAPSLQPMTFPGNAVQRDFPGNGVVLPN